MSDLDTKQFFSFVGCPSGFITPRTLGRDVTLKKLTYLALKKTQHYTFAHSLQVIPNKIYVRIDLLHKEISHCR